MHAFWKRDEFEGREKLSLKRFTEKEVMRRTADGSGPAYFPEEGSDINTLNSHYNRPIRGVRVSFIDDVRCNLVKG
jgi:hypothetical protein